VRLLAVVGAASARIAGAASQQLPAMGLPAIMLASGRDVISDEDRMPVSCGRFAASAANLTATSPRVVDIAGAQGARFRGSGVAGTGRMLAPDRPHNVPKSF
jgi:hypothetical protein